MVRNKGCCIERFPKDFVILDIETTGFSPAKDRIIELASLKVENMEIVDTFSSLVNPEIWINSQIENLTGITNMDVRGEPLIEDIIVDFRDFIGNDVVVAHNATFDTNFVYDNYIRCLGQEFRNDYIDTLKIARRVLPFLKSHKLSILAEYFEVESDGYHRALDDCKVLFEVIKNLQKML